MKNTILLIATVFFTATVTAQNLSSSPAVAITTLANFDAQQKGGAVQLSWVALNERDLSRHEIQKSTNGSAFTNIGTITAQNSASTYSYTFLDATPTAGNNYYRLRSIDRKGYETVSNIIEVNQGVGKTDLRVLGNPLQAGILNLQLSNINSGKYFISLYSNAGERILARSLNLTDGSLTQTINLPGTLARGLYFLEFTNGDLRINKQVLLQ